MSFSNVGTLKDAHGINPEDVFSAGIGVYSALLFVYIVICIGAAYEPGNTQKTYSSPSKLFFGEKAPKESGLVAIAILSFIFLALDISATALYYSEKDKFIFTTWGGLFWLFQALFYAFMSLEVVFLHMRKKWAVIGFSFLSVASKVLTVYAASQIMHFADEESIYRTIFGLETTSAIWTVVYCGIYYAWFSKCGLPGMMDWEEFEG